MNQDAPIDQGLFNQKTLSAQEIIKRLQANGFYEAYETYHDSVEINGVNSLKCRIIKNQNGYWTPKVSIEPLSVYVVLPAIALRIIAGISGFGAGVMMPCIILGLGIGALILQNKKKTTYARLEEIISVIS
ncbi:MAG: hypothetical protein WCR52_17425 [Bacteroidota bacterium]